MSEVPGGFVVLQRLPTGLLDARDIGPPGKRKGYLAAPVSHVFTQQGNGMNLQN
jgi:hypothetical protein